MEASMFEEYDFEKIFIDNNTQVKETIKSFLEYKGETLNNISPKVSLLGENIVPLIQNGKKIRALLCYWAWKSVTDVSSVQNIYRIATSLELFHIAALVHDDIIDDSSIRRGHPSSHIFFADTHRKQNFLGNSNIFGRNTAILAGDLYLSWAEEMFNTTPGLPMNTRHIFNSMKTEVLCGQYLDILEESTKFQIDNQESTIKNIFNIIEYKTARYSVEKPLIIGASFALHSKNTSSNRTDTEIKKILDSYSALGITLGTAFQLRDDLLDIFGDPEQTGKPNNTDLRNGKHTLLLAHTFKKSLTKERKTLISLLGKPALEDSEIKTIKEIIVHTGALEEIENIIEHLYEKSLTSLENMPIDKKAKENLKHIFKFIVHRSM